MQNNLQKQYNYLLEKKEKLLENISEQYHYLWEIDESYPIKEQIKQLKKDINLLEGIIFYDNLTPLERAILNSKNS